MGTYTYGHVARGKEKPFEIVLALIRGVKHYKIENVPKIGHLELVVVVLKTQIGFVIKIGKM
jgi:hypothetical protein